MTRNTWIIFVVICVLILGGLIWSSTSNRVDVSSVDQHSALPATEASGNIADWTKGADDPVVTIVEYADFQCPGCASAAPVMSQVIDQYGEHVQLVYRHFPLSTIHPNARAAAAAAEAAGKQDAFWQMHDQLYAAQNEWAQASGANRSDIFADYAAAFGLDRDQFIDDLSSSEINTKINFDAALGREAGAQSTPSLYIDGELIDGYFLDDEIVSQGTEGARQLWSDAEAFGKFVIEPRLRDAGVELDEE